MKYLVTGATAFAGCHLIKLLLEEGCEVYATTRRTNGSETDVLDIMSVEDFEKIDWIFCELTNKRSCFKAIEHEKYDGIFHLAAQSHPPTGFKVPFYTYDVNVLGTLNILEAVNEIQPESHFMFCSTSEVYGSPVLEDGQAVDETFPMAPINPYASSKTAIDVICQERFRNEFLNGFVTRAFSHTGPKRGKIFSISSDAFQIANILAGKQERTIKVGNLKSSRAVMDVRDCVKAYYMLMKRKAIGTFNIGAEEVHEIGYFLDIMLELSDLKGKVKLEVEPKFVRPIDIPIQIPDCKTVKEMTGWKCAIPIDKTLADLLEYWNKKVGSY